MAWQAGVWCQQTPNPETRLRGRSRYGAAKARNLKPVEDPV